MFLKIALRVMGINLKKEAEKLEESLEEEAEEEAGFVSWEPTTSDIFVSFNRLNARAFRVTNANIVGKTVGEIPSLFHGKVVVDSIKHGDAVFTPESSTVFHADDIIALIASRHNLLKAADVIGPETIDRDVLSLENEVLDVCVLNPTVAGMTIEKLNHKMNYKCFVRKIFRHGHSLPLTKSTLIKKCDILQIEGGKKDIAEIINYLGFQEKQVALSDMVMIGLGSVLGILFGMITIRVGEIPISLSMGVGVLIFGLLFGWMRSYHPRMGQISTGAQWIFTDLGLNLFIVCVGLTAAPKAIAALQHNGLTIFAMGAIVTIIPVFIALLVGRFVFKLHPVLLFGAIAGAKTNTASLNILKEEAESFARVLGYIVPYTLSNITLTIAGILMIYLM